LQAQKTPQLISSSKADTWVATDVLGRQVSTGTGIKKDKYVGIFYFVWQGAHGFDMHGRGARKDEGISDKQPSDTASPYDITKLLAANPNDPQYGPEHAFHYWSEPYFGYYLPDDEWIIRKHAQMLSDAGIDVIILDVTNAAIYLPQVTKIAETYRAMRKEGKTTPSFAFIVNSNPVKTVQRLYNNIYARNLFKDLWFIWKGKPLLLAPPKDLSDTLTSFFNIRQSWAWTKDAKWFGDGKDKWPWIDHSPQNYGWHESKEKPEEISVAIAEHPTSNVGRSFHDSKQPAPDSLQSKEGLYFSEQWKRVLQVDPEFVFVTGWNEWVAMRFSNGGSGKFLGNKIEKGETYFVDLYNEEYSRDAEPENGKLGDAYYYQLVNNIRLYKGARPIPSYTQNNKIVIDKNVTDWKNVKASFTDDMGDTIHRNHTGWGRIKAYTNFSGRNDIVEAKVAASTTLLSFYVRTYQSLTSSKDSNWMHLYINTQNAALPSWQGFQYRVSNYNNRNSTVQLEKSLSGFSWQSIATLKYAKGNNEIEISIPKKSLGIDENSFTIDFKWTDNIPSDGNALHWLDKGDVAPNARFSYRYIHQ
jgi:hypothetical protein